MINKARLRRKRKRTESLNQIAKALNTDIAKGEPFEAVKVLHLLIAINENLELLKESKK